MRDKILTRIALLEERKDICESILADRQKDMAERIERAVDLETTLHDFYKEVKARKEEIAEFRRMIKEYRSLIGNEEEGV